MTLQELIQRERISANELRGELNGVIETAIKRQLERLNDLEIRIEKEALTNGKVSIPLPVEINSGLSVAGIPEAMFTGVPPVEEKKESKKGKPDRE